MLVIVHPMTSYSGSVAYLEYVAKSDKGGITNGTRFNGVFDLGNANLEDRMRYTSQAVVESVTPTAEGKITLTAAWYPLAKKHVDAYDSAYEPTREGANYDVKFLNANGDEVTGLTFTVTGTDNNIITVDSGASEVAKVAYKYNQEYIPANDIPSIGPRMKNIPLVAEPRRIAVQYDQITAFQAKTDYGFSLDKQIAEQACGELAYKKFVA